MHGRPIFEGPYTVGAVFVHGDISERSDRACRPARRLLPPAPSPREGVWGWGNGKKAVLPSAQSRKSAVKADFQSFVDYYGKLSNLWEDLRKLEKIAESVEDC